MKVRYFVGLLLLLLAFSLSVCAADYVHEKKQYIVYQSSDSVSLLGEDEFPVFSVVGESTLMKMLEANPDLRYEEDCDIFLIGEYSDPFYSQKWDLNMIGAETAWKAGYTGEGIKIAVIDSGVMVDHPDLQENMLPGACYTDTTGEVTDNYGHGTFAAGMIAAGLNGIGTVGAAPQAKIVPLKCFEEKSGKLSYLVSAIRDAVDVYGCKIINMSLGTTTNSELLEEAVNYALGKGCILVAAVGNDGNAVLNYPAAYDGVIGVGSVDSTKAVSAFSQRNGSVMLVAPGEKVVSTYNNGGYAAWSGTSFAAPLASAAAAVLLGFDDTLESAEMASLLKTYAEDLGDAGYDTSYGYGLLDLGRCVRALMKTPGDADRDGLFTVRDALLLLHALLNADDSVDAELADVDGDGYLSLRDVILVCKMAAA